VLIGIGVGGRNGPREATMGLAGWATRPKAAKLGREGPPGMEVAATGLIETLRATGSGDTQPQVGKVESGDPVTAGARSWSQGPRE
jgi:hypothetical protein